MKAFILFLKAQTYMITIHGFTEKGNDHERSD